MQRKIGKQSNKPDTNHDLIMLAKNLLPNLNCEPKSSLPTRSQTQPLVPYCPKRNKASSASSTHGRSHKKKLCILIVINQGTKRLNVRRNLAMLSKAKRLDPMPSEYR